MKRKLFGMDSFFYNSTGYYPFETRCEMLKELGFDGMYFFFWSDWPVCWQDFPKLARVRERYGLEVASVYAAYDIAKPATDDGNAKVARVFESVEGCNSIDLALTAGNASYMASDPQGDAAALAALEKLLAIADRRGLTVGLYHHIGFWMEKFADCARLCRALDHPRLKMNFCGFHWYACDDSVLFPLLERHAGLIHSVNLCGSRKPGVNGLPATIEPLDEGEMDNFAAVWKLDQLGFNGWFGLQGYAVGSDVYRKLQRSISCFREFEERLSRHPNWRVEANPR